MAYDSIAASGYFQILVTGYESLENKYIIKGPTNVSDFWATGALDITIYAITGADPFNSDDLDANVISVDQEQYNPYFIYHTMSGKDVEVRNPTWEIYCSGMMPSGIFSAIQNEVVTGLTGDEVKSLIYKYSGKINAYRNMVMMAGYTQFIKDVWF